MIKPPRACRQDVSALTPTKRLTAREIYRDLPTEDLRRLREQFDADRRHAQARETAIFCAKRLSVILQILRAREDH
jgi:hypothetical protein